MNFTRLNISNLPEAVLVEEAVAGFCPICFAVVPDVLVSTHVKAAHPEAKDE